MSHKIFKQFSDYCCSFVPEKVEVKSASHVINYYKNDIIVDSNNEDTLISVKAVKPLFTVDLYRNDDENNKGFLYSFPPKKFVEKFLSVFNWVVSEL